MKTPISTQSQNEVKDLLTEYVVSPLNTDITGTLNNISRSIDSLEGATKTEIDNIKASINGRIGELQRKLDNSFHFDDNEDAFEQTVNEINNSIDRILKEVPSLIEKASGKEKTAVTEAEKRIRDDIKKTEKTIQTSISENQGAVNSRLKEAETAAKKEIEEIKKITDAQTSHTEAAEKFSEQIAGDYKEILTRIDKLEQTVSNGLDSSGDAIAEYSDATISAINDSKSEIQVLTQKNYKTAFTISLALGITNFLGIISIIILYLVK